MGSQEFLGAFGFEGMMQPGGGFGPGGGFDRGRGVGPGGAFGDGAGFDPGGRTRGGQGHGRSRGHGHPHGRGPRGGEGREQWPHEWRGGGEDRRGPGPRGGGVGPDLVSALISAMEDGGMPLGFGFGGPRGRGPQGRGGRRRARRGDVRTGIVLLLAEEPRNGYGLIRELSERSGGEWNPSSGAVYPALSQLEDEGLIEPAVDAGPKYFTLTAAGREEAERLSERRAPWESDDAPASQADAFGGPLKAMWTSYGQVALALRAVMSEADDDVLRQAAAELDALRRRLYGLLAEDGDFTDVEDDDADADPADDRDPGAGAPPETGEAEI